MDDRFEVTVGAGTMMSASGSAVRFPHRWTPGGVTAEAGFTGGHLLHLAVAARRPRDHGRAGTWDGGGLMMDASQRHGWDIHAL